MKPQASPTELPAAKPGRKKWPRRLVVVVAVLALLSTAGVIAFNHIYILYANFHVVVDKQVYRSARPNPSRIQDWSGEYGIKTILNLEGGDEEDSYFVENTAKARDLGIGYTTIKLASSRLPTSDQVHEMIRVIETCPKPMLIHCRAGSERSGLGSVIAAMALGHQDYKDAREQLSAKYLHLWHGVDRAEGLVDRYEDYCSIHNLDTAGWTQFRDWAMNLYQSNPHAATAPTAVGSTR